jgi:hypothetical protein
MDAAALRDFSIDPHAPGFWSRRSTAKRPKRGIGFECATPSPCRGCFVLRHEILSVVAGPPCIECGNFFQQVLTGRLSE